MAGWCRGSLRTRWRRRLRRSAGWLTKPVVMAIRWGSRRSCHCVFMVEIEEASERLWIAGARSARPTWDSRRTVSDALRLPNTWKCSTNTNSSPTIRCQSSRRDMVTIVEDIPERQLEGLPVHVRSLVGSEQSEKVSVTQMRISGDHPRVRINGNDVVYYAISGS